MRLRRLLACDSPEEACRIVRSMLPLIADKAAKPLNFTRLLNELLRFGGSASEEIKIGWAKDFYCNQQNRPDGTDDAGETA